jgi:hypothetical protein
VVVLTVACAATLGATRAARWLWIPRIEKIGVVVLIGRKGHRHHLGWDNRGGARTSCPRCTRKYHGARHGHLVGYAIGIDGGDGDSRMYLWDPRLNQVLPWLSDYMWSIIRWLLRLSTTMNFYAPANAPGYCKIMGVV